MTTEDYTAYVEGAWQRLFRTAYALTGDVRTAEELLQSTLVKVSAGGTNTHLRGTGWDCRLGGGCRVVVPEQKQEIRLVAWDL